MWFQDGWCALKSPVRRYGVFVDVIFVTDERKDLKRCGEFGGMYAEEIVIGLWRFGYIVAHVVSVVSVGCRCFDGMVVLMSIADPPPR